MGCWVPVAFGDRCESPHLFILALQALERLPLELARPFASFPRSYILVWVRLGGSAPFKGAGTWPRRLLGGGKATL